MLLRNEAGPGPQPRRTPYAKPIARWLGSRDPDAAIGLDILQPGLELGQIDMAHAGWPPAAVDENKLPEIARQTQAAA